MQKNIMMRHSVTKTIRNYLDECHFTEIETPILTKSTPEGARDFLVPSRVNKNEFFALPQSPQIYKQLLMISGFERYYQIAKCFRDEDLRSDRQPEFTQVDIEISFVEESDIMLLTESMLKEVVKVTKNIDIIEKFPVIDYKTAMNKYGVDKPDIRFEMFLHDVTIEMKNSKFNVFKNAEKIKFFVAKNGMNTYTRKSIDELTNEAKKLGAKGLA
jgi:aspartyl-tRNA synthetase